MSELKFSGTATLTGFPRDRSFNFELDGPDRLVIKAGKEIFLIIEKEAAPVIVEFPPTEFIGRPERTAAEQRAINLNMGEVTLSVPNVPPLGQPVASETPTPEPEKARKPRGPNVVIDDNSIIVIDQNRANPYTKLRGKYYETLKTAHGRTVGWWKETSMVKSLEGSPPTLLKFFLGEGVLQLQHIAQPVQTAPVVPILPTQTTPGPMWTPPPTDGAAPQSGGPKFL